MTRQIRIEGDIAYVPLTKGYEAIIDADDVSKVDLWNWSAQVALRADGTIRSVYAVRRSAREGTVSMHRVICETPAGMVTDHKDGNGLNNRKSNLRPATYSQNGQNSRKKNKDPGIPKGITRAYGTRWHAQIKINRKKISLGNYATPEDAAAAYAEGSKKYHGNFGRIE